MRRIICALSYVGMRVGPAFKRYLARLNSTGTKGYDQKRRAIYLKNY